MKLPVDRTRCFRLALTVVLVACTFAALGCGSDDKGGGGKFKVETDVDHFAGPTPLIVRLKATAKNADGDVSYRWRFDDGTTSTKPEVTKTFSRAGYYQVSLDAHDESGINDGESFLFGAWPPEQWSKAQRSPLTKKGALEAQRVQQQRTDRRRKAQREALRRKAREQTAG